MWQPGRGHAMKLEDTIRDMLASGAAISTGDVAKVAGVTRQAAHYQLARLVANNEVRGVGAGRSSRYLLNSSFSRTYTLPQLEEDVVWKEFEAALDASGATSPGNVRSILAYAFTEMLNNAIDHSRGSKARVLGWCSPGEVTFEIQDDGVGVFRTIRE